MNFIIINLSSGQCLKVLHQEAKFWMQLHRLIWENSAFLSESYTVIGEYDSAELYETLKPSAI